MGIRNLGAVKQLQEPNNVTCHAESKFSEGRYNKKGRQNVYTSRHSERLERRVAKSVSG